MDWTHIVTAIISGIVGPTLLLLIQRLKSRKLDDASAAEKIIASAEKVVDISEGIISKLEEKLNELQDRVDKLEENLKRLRMSNDKMRVRMINLEQGIRQLTTQIVVMGAEPAWTPIAFFDRTVVIVDDNPAFRRTLSGSLKLAGYNVAEAASGKEAKEELERDQYAIVLLDLRLEGETGLDVFKMIRKLNSDIPVIIVSAYLEGMPQENQKALAELNAYINLPKPLAIEELIKTLCRIRSDELVARVNSL